MRKGAIALGVVAAIAVAGGLAFWAKTRQYAESLKLDDWEDASPGDCPLMARALLDGLPADTINSLPLIGQSQGPGPCDWSRYGLHPQRLTYARFKSTLDTPIKLHGRWIPHISLSRPHYSAFPLRADVYMGVHNHGLDGYTISCRYKFELKGWQLEQCFGGGIS